MCGLSVDCGAHKPSYDRDLGLGFNGKLIRLVYDLLCTTVETELKSCNNIRELEVTKIYIVMTIDPLQESPGW